MSLSALPRRSMPKPGAPQQLSAGCLGHPADPVYEHRIARRRLEPQPDRHMLVAEVDSEVVGSLGLTVPPGMRRRHAGQIWMAVRDDHQGEGIGRALMESAVELADRWLNLRRLELEVFVGNEPAIALYRKLGFEIEGTLKEFAFRDGSYADVYAMARLRPGQPAKEDTLTP
jgi:putative acetyltransferase